MALQTTRICCATIGSSLRNNVTIVAQQLLRPCATISRVWQVAVSLGLRFIKYSNSIILKKKLSRLDYC